MEFKKIALKFKKFASPSANFLVKPVQLPNAH